MKILENGGTLKSVPDSYKNKQMCSKAFDNSARISEFVFDCHETQKTCKKTLNTYPSAIQFAPEAYKKCEIKLLILVLLYLIDVKPK